MAQAPVGFPLGIQKKRHFRDPVQHAGDDVRRPVGAVAGVDGHVDVHRIALEPFQRLRGEIRHEAVVRGDGPHQALIGDDRVGGFYRVRKTELDLVLTGAGFVISALRLEAHLHQGFQHFPADLFTAVIRKTAHITGIVKGHQLRSFFLQEVELHGGADVKGKALLLCLFNSLLQNGAAVVFKKTSVGIIDVAEHPADPVLFLMGQAFRKHRVGRSIRPDQQVDLGLGMKAGDLRRIQ